MRTIKKAAYILVAIFAILILLCFIINNYVEGHVFLWIALGLFVPFTGLYIALIVDGARNGWKDEKILPNRMKRETLLIDLYIGSGKRKYCLDIYPGGDVQEFVQLLKLAETDGHADRTLEKRMIGQIVLNAAELNKISGQEIATSKHILNLVSALRDLEDFSQNNTFHIY